MEKTARLQQRIRELTLEVSELLRQADHSQALRCFSELEALEPRDPEWPLRAAQSHRALGEKLPWVRAVGRAAALYANAGALQKAITAWKLILSVDPEHLPARRRLAELHASRRRPSRRMRHSRRVTTRPGTSPAEEKAACASPGPCRAALLAAGIRPTFARARREEGRTEVEAPPAPAASTADAELFQRLIALGRTFRLEAGLAVFEQNDAPDAMYVIVRGSAIVIEEGPPARELYQLGPGDFFGERALVSDDGRDVTVETCETTELVAIDRHAVHAWLQCEPEALPRLHQLICQRLLEHWGHTNPLFAGFSAQQRRRLAAKFQFFAFEDGHPLIEQGARPPGAFVLVCGQARVVQRVDNQDRVLGSLAAGSLCGEMSMLDADAAAASVVCAGNGFALMLPEHDFRVVCSAHPQFLERVNALSSERRKVNQSVLAQRNSPPPQQHCAIRPPPRVSASHIYPPTVPRLAAVRMAPASQLR